MQDTHSEQASASRGAGRARLKIGVLIDGFSQPAWIHSMLSGVASSGIAEIALVVKKPEPPKPTPKRFARLRAIAAQILRPNLYGLYIQKDRARKVLRPDAFEHMDVREIIGNARVLEVTPIEKGFSDYFDDADIDQILSYDLDVLLRVGFRILRGRILECAKHGVWSHHHGDNNVNRGGPAGFWEVMEQHPCTGSILQVLSESLDAGKVIYRSYASTRFDSVAANKNNYYWKTSQFVLRKLRNLHELGADALTSLDQHYSPYSNRLYENPTNRQMLGLLGSLYNRKLHARIAEKTSYDQWFIAFRFRKRLSDQNNAFYQYTHVNPPKDRFWADPCPVRLDDKYWVFLEEYMYDTARGHISVMQVNPDGTWSEPVPVLRRDYHLSYPYVFEYEGGFYMIPESARNKTVELYACDSFPDKWSFHSLLLSGMNAVDATVCAIDGAWWMFVAQGVPGALNSDELFLYYADSPLGPWKPHKRNPVKSDVRSARPAGRIFESNGRYYRPSQDCSRAYGWAISINQIAHISPDAYRETEVSKILPHWAPGLRATHTLNYAGDLGVIDGLRRAPRFRI